MSMSDELQRLAELHERGVLSSEEFARAKQRVIDGQTSGVPTAGDDGRSAINGLRRSRDDRWIGGVCGGIARSTGVESWIVRLCFAILFLMWGTGLLLYALLWIFVPEDPSPI